MSDTFDPDAWPHTPTPTGSRPDNSNDDDELPRRVDDDDDNYDPLTIGEPVGSGYGDPSATYSDDETDDYEPDTYDYDYDAPATTEPRPVDEEFEDDDDIRDNYDSYDQYDDDDETDNYNNYDDFGDDNGGGGGGGLKKVLIGIGAAVVVLVLLIGGISLLGGKKSSDNATNKTTTTAKGQTSTTFVGSTDPLPADVTTALNQALGAWGKFAVDGNLDDVRPYFVNSGPQFVHFQAEAPSISSAPPGGQPLVFAMTNAKTVSPDSNTWIIHGTVVVSRTGEKDQSFPWEIRMTRASAQQPWQVLTVRQY